MWKSPTKRVPRPGELQGSQIVPISIEIIMKAESLQNSETRKLHVEAKVLTEPRPLGSGHSTEFLQNSKKPSGAFTLPNFASPSLACPASCAIRVSRVPAESQARVVRCR